MAIMKDDDSLQSFQWERSCYCVGQGSLPILDSMMVLPKLRTRNLNGSSHATEDSNPKLTDLESQSEVSSTVRADCRPRCLPSLANLVPEWARSGLRSARRGLS